MSLKDKFLNFFKRDDDVEMQPPIPEEIKEEIPKEIKDPTIKNTWVGSEHIADSNLRWELKKIAKSENTTMRKIVEGLVKEYVDNYNTPKKTVNTTKCAFCGKEFVKSHNAEKYCSDECRLDGRKVIQRRHNTKKQKATTSHSKRKGRKPSLETLPNGLKLKASDCHLYSPLPWWGGNGNIYYGNGRKFPFTLSQLRDLKKRFDEIPKLPEDRCEWIKENYNIELKSCDRILWNLYRGTFDHIFEAYYQKNYRLQFDNNGKVVIGE